MGVQVKYGTAGATGGGWSTLPGALQSAYEEPHARPHWDWQRRAPRSLKDRWAWVSLWPRGTFGAGANDGSAAYVPLGLDYGAQQGYEPFTCDGEGTQTLKWLKGTVVDVSGNGLSGAQLHAFRTSDDAYAGYEVESRTDGSYDLPTPYSGANHYVVAYLAGSPDRAGTTANTLVPTNIDGT